MSRLLSVKEFYEHENSSEISDCFHEINKSILFRNKEGKVCADIISKDYKSTVSTNYYIGTDWLIENELAILVSPKLSKGSKKIDYLQMLYSCLKNPDILYSYTVDLYEIKFDKPSIELEQKNDQLTPLLVVHFTHILKSIVIKGLKRAYYKVENNLAGKVKGKVLVNKTVKHNILKHKPFKVICSYDEFGLNSLENRILKKALIFCQRYLAAFPEYQKYALPTLSFCAPAFELVDDQIDINEIRSIKPNAFYKEYTEGIRLAKMILKRFGYNIKSTEKTKIISTPPFWIDMAKLFELYVLGLLKERYGEKLLYHFTRRYNELDYLLNTDTHKIIIDAKYRPQYSDRYEIEDIRQLSGYARLKDVLKELGFKTDEEQARAVVDCLIIYSDQTAEMELASEIKKDEIHHFVKFYKHGIRLPEIA